MYGSYIQLFDEIQFKLAEAIYYNIFGTIYKLFDGIFDGIKNNRNELDYIC